MIRDKKVMLFSQMVLGSNPGASAQQMTGPLQVTSPPRLVPTLSTGVAEPVTTPATKTAVRNQDQVWETCPNAARQLKTSLMYARDEWILLSHCPQGTHSGW